ncbi:hypothetical protein H634G_09251 [Metarhizium anisopliae BRIP 53293]|uniref:Uncharacterized protein n=1 Tax=Metarhizium anisopliae BRIP 53293 TaxID=1291518 RepID=A0A0D9NPQ8_METAN|nr:hypothetical protein H634G_09251 [Metarhizium anisopliae BRIP 53293]KJK89111.1 hypothetical protein H633G_07029 [Metarhizium anisopliae BRIP 53284]
MDQTLPDHRAITVPVPTADITAEVQNQGLEAAAISHFVVQRFNLLMQLIAGIPYDFDKPWPFWFYIGKIVSKAFFSVEDQLEWLNAVRVRTREFIAFSNTSTVNDNGPNDETRRIQVVEVNFLKPQPGENIKLFWKPARGIISKQVENWIDYQSSQSCN